MSWMPVKRKLGRISHADYEQQKELREKAILFLGAKCSNPKCLVPNGCNDKRCLQIDHIHGIGEEGRKIGIALYLDILENPNAKSIYQLLCANCNWIKRVENKEVKNGWKQRKTATSNHVPHFRL